MLAEAYVLGEEIIDAKYKKTVVKTLLAARRSSRWNMGPKSVDIVYRGTCSTSPFRRLIADSVADQAFDDVSWMEYFDGYPKEALVDAMKATVRVRSRPRHGLDFNLYLEEETNT
jgi:hypothetical protein